MPAPPRIVPPPSDRGLTGVALLAGLLAAATMIATVRLVGWVRAPIPFGEFAGPAVCIAPFLVLMVVAISRAGVRSWRLLALVALASGTAMASLAAYSVLGGDDGGARWPVRYLLNASILIAVFAAVAAALSAALLAAIRLWAWRVRVQTGTLCWRCGYDLGADPRIQTCPECGDRRDSGPRVRAIDRALGALRRRALPAVAALAAVGAAWAAVRVYTVTWPVRTFHSAFLLGSSRPVHIALDPPASPEFNLVPAGEVPIVGDASRVFIIGFRPPSRADQPAMRIMLAAAQPAGLQAAYVQPPDQGEPPIYCDLDMVLARRVLREGVVPQSLQQALLRLADEKGWHSTGTHLAGLESGAIRVDPRPHFPP